LLRRKRQRLIARAWWKQRELTQIVSRLDGVPGDAILGFVCLRNEAERLPFFLDHHRGLGVQHFLIVDNASDDGSFEMLADQPDVSLWRTAASYRKSRFGMDWINGLLMRHGHGHWCLTLDVDELFIYPHHDTRPLRALTDWLDTRGIPAMGALMLELYPKGRITDASHRSGQNPTEVLNWYDAANYTMHRKPGIGALVVQGGPRPRALLADPARGPTLTKVPLIRWHWRYAYVNSTHALLPPRMNLVYGCAGETLTGALLHTKFLPVIAAKSTEELHRQQHFGDPRAFGEYHAALAQGPDLWCPASTPWRGWQDLHARGLISAGGWA
jgi:hypothetical protein